MKPASIAIALLSSACSIINAPNRPDAALLAYDAGVDSEAPNDSGATDAGVMLAHYPPRPTVVDTPGGAELFLALGWFFAPAASLAVPIGYDLDGRDTRAPTYDSECVLPTPSDDLAMGIDNVIAVDQSASDWWSVLVGGPGPPFAEAFNLDGIDLLVLRIRQWSGAPDDPAVDVALSGSVFATAEASDGSQPAIIVEHFQPFLTDGSPAPEPIWNGHDYVWLRSDAFTGADPEQPLVQINAWVAGGVLVVPIPGELTLTLRNDLRSVVVRLTDVVITTPISTALHPVVIAGRWPLSNIRSDIESAGYCDGSKEHALLLSDAERAADLLATSSDPGATCDAISVGLVGNGELVRVGGLTDPRPLTLLCPAGAFCLQTSDCLAISGRENDCTQRCLESRCATDPVGGTPDGNVCGTNATERDICLDQQCVPSRCGDGYIDRSANVPEYCDDGNLDEADQCTTACTRSCEPPFPTLCDDGDACSGLEACTGGICTVTSATLPDRTPCTPRAGGLGECQQGRCTPL
jgi:cysteine-rich repeat protein